ncbi:Endoribonuclease YbeY [Candidatus Erwinia haradaeae]|uniref:Endoribonuclease YbeY n=1 Tax=Candidatus Erwinia haradaeae TaxID=1922217 RepID=A0A451DD11_9GAMM|nr:rRNA maturation RNase YbeY [Candidatus Erwinia haradaeae]VFP84294.1 Endoribonuclease YbeY [Candidatus Erwinia haradaeae]
MFLDLQVACESDKGLPIESDFVRWIEAAIPVHHKKQEVMIRIVDVEEMQRLNLMFCKQDKPTNILSFPFTPPDYIETALLGDLIICRQIVELEAIKQSKSLLSHWAHMVIHGMLHLLGYDHHLQHTADQMESLETRIMFFLGYPDPYVIEKECIQ